MWTVCLRLLPGSVASRLRFEPRPYCAWVNSACIQEDKKILDFTMWQNLLWLQIYNYHLTDEEINLIRLSDTMTASTMLSLITFLSLSCMTNSATAPSQLLSQWCIIMFFKYTAPVINNIMHYFKFLNTRVHTNIFISHFSGKIGTACHLLILRSVW